MIEEETAFRVPDLADATVYIVGGTSGVGIQVARHFVRAGTQRIGLVGRNLERGRQASEHIFSLASGLWAPFVAGDVNDPDEAERVTDELRDSIGPADILINSTTSSFTPRLFFDIDPGDIPRILLEQALGPINMCRAVLPDMRAQRGGAIVTVASDAAKVPTPGETVIGAAMSALVTFSRTLAMEAKRDGVRVNAVTPSLIKDTGAYDRVMAEPFSAKLFEKAGKRAGLGVAEPGDIADLVLFLCSPQARRITAQVVSVNGGISAG